MRLRPLTAQSSESSSTRISGASRRSSSDGCWTRRQSSGSRSSSYASSSTRTRSTCSSGAWGCGLRWRWGCSGSTSGGDGSRALKRRLGYGRCSLQPFFRINILTDRDLACIFRPLTFYTPLEKACRMMSHLHPSAGHAPSRTHLASRIPLAVGAALLFLAPRVVGAQNPPPSQSQAALQQAIQQQPGLADVLRQRIGQSGLTAEQIRARLQASGYPPTLLDAYIGAAQPGQATSVPSAQELGAIQALGLPAIAVQVESLPVDTGLVRAVRGAAPERRSAVFGVDVFRRTTTQFLPLLSGPVPPDYKLGPGDVLVLILTGEVELAYTLQITREGFVLIPQVGQVYLSNITLSQAHDALYPRLARVYSGVRRPNATIQFDLSVANVRANQVYVVGEVAQPGAYQISSLGTVLTALYASGGITERQRGQHRLEGKYPPLGTYQPTEGNRRVPVVRTDIEQRLTRANVALEPVQQRALGAPEDWPLDSRATT